MSAAEPCGKASATVPDVIEMSGEFVVLQWTVHLLKRDPGRAWPAVAAVGIAAGLGYLLFHSWLFAALGGLLVFSSAAEYLLPIRYRITSSGASAQYGAVHLDISWDHVRRILHGHDAVKLSPLSAPSRLDPFRGVILRFPEPGDTIGCDNILQIITERVPKELSAQPSSGSARESQP